VNTVVWSEQGRLMALAGFGNLPGEVSVWDIVDRVKLGHFTANSASFLKFSPCSRKLLTATVNPKLRVQNRYQVWSYTGVLLATTNHFDSELYDLEWLQVGKAYPPRGASPGRLIFDPEEFEKSKKEKKMFRPPGTVDLSELLQLQEERLKAAAIQAKEAK
jgi:translation initiation factor 2A